MTSAHSFCSHPIVHHISTFSDFIARVTLLILCCYYLSIFSSLFFFFFFFFFFQAEDGIRDLIVTGVQTCALPILCRLLLHRTLQPVAFSADRPRAPRALHQLAEHRK